MQNIETDVGEQPFPTREYESRLDSVQSTIRERGLDAFMMTTPENIVYLTGYDTTGYYSYQALIIPDSSQPQFVIREFEGPNVEARSWTTEWKGYRDTHEENTSIETTAGIGATAALIEEMGVEDKIIGFERDSWFLTHRQLVLLQETIDAKFVGCTGIVEAGRRIKSQREIDYMCQAGSIAENALQTGIEAIEPGVNENAVAAEIYADLIRNGSGHTGTQLYTTSGRRSALPHARWKGRTLEEGDVIYIEVPAAIHRYHGCLLRSAYIGEPPAEVSAAGEAVAEGLTAAIETIKPGITAGDVDEACRGIIADHGFGSQFPHRTGYSLGIGYPPGWGEGHIVSLGPGDDTVLERNMTFHMPVIVFLPEHGAIGCSATVRVSEDGCEPIADIDRKLYVKTEY